MKRSNFTTALNVIGIVVGMFALAYASVPLYDLFCRVTGFAGTTQVSAKIPDKIYDREITVLFNTDVNPELAWEFKPLQKKVKVKVGESKLVFFEATNISDKPVEGIASYNVVPEGFGAYFNKLQCFCFERQVLKPNETMNFPVSFFIDPEMLKDEGLKGKNDVTLSYTFFPYKN